MVTIPSAVLDSSLFVFIVAEEQWGVWPADCKVGKEPEDWKNPGRRR